MYISWLKIKKKILLVNNSLLELKHKYQLAIRLKGIEYHEELFYYLFSYIGL